MQTLRALSKSLAFVTLLCGSAALWAMGLLCAGWSAAWRWRWRCFAFRQWARATAALLGMRLHASGGTLRGTAQPVMIVANHLSYLDVLVLAQQCDAVFVAKSEVAHWPLIGVLSRCVGTIFLERGRRRDILRVNGLIERALCDGQSVIVFPEGTSSAGARVLPFRSPLLEPAARLGVPVRYASLHYATAAHDEPAATALCWWGEMEFVPHLWRLFQRAPFAAVFHLGEQPLMTNRRKVLTRALQAEVSEDFARLQSAVLPETTPVRQIAALAHPLSEESL